MVPYCIFIKGRNSQEPQEGIQIHLFILHWGSCEYPSPASTEQADSFSRLTLVISDLMPLIKNNSRPSNPKEATLIFSLYLELMYFINVYFFWSKLI